MTCFHPESVQMLLDIPEIDVNAQNSVGKTALMEKMWSSLPKKEPISMLLAREDIDVNLQDIRGRTALHYAVMASAFKATKGLLRRPDIDLTLKDENGRTARDLAIGNRSMENVFEECFEH